MSKTSVPLSTSLTLKRPKEIIMSCPLTRKSGEETPIPMDSRTPSIAFCPPWSMPWQYLE